MSDDKLDAIKRELSRAGGLASGIDAALQQARELGREEWKEDRDQIFEQGREEERKALREKIESIFNPHADRLVLDCGRCEDEVPYDYTVTEEAWSVVPDQYRLGVLCLSCLDGLTLGGLDPDSILAVYATVHQGTVPLLPARQLLAALDARFSQSYDREADVKAYGHAYNGTGPTCETCYRPSRHDSVHRQSSQGSEKP